MPTYNVIEPGFYDGKLYHPEGKRPVLTTDKALKPVPKWLEQAETKQTRNTRAKPAAKKNNPSFESVENQVEILG